jgi:uncharacterized protein YcbK (DUF882 family)
MSEYLNKFKLSQYFNLKEFECPCCNTVKLEPYLVNCLDALRIALKCKIIVTSGYRCIEHNKEVCGVRTSRHLQGRAADVIIQKYDNDTVLKLARKIGFKYCYYNMVKAYYHLDIGGLE